MDKQTFFIRNSQIANNAAEFVRGIEPDEDSPMMVVISKAKISKTREQEERYHAMIGDISKQYDHFGQKWNSTDMKRILVDAFKRDTANDPDLMPEWAKMGEVRMAPCIGGGGFVVLGDQTRNFSRKLGSAFIEWLFAFGAENGIRWSA